MLAVAVACRAPQTCVLRSLIARPCTKLTTTRSALPQKQGLSIVTVTPIRGSCIQRSSTTRPVQCPAEQHHIRPSGPPSSFCSQGNRPAIARAQFRTASHATITPFSVTMELKEAEKNLADLGYYFNDALQMRQVANDKPFEFTTQTHYEELGDTVAEYIQEAMVAKYGMQRVYLPLPRGGRGARMVEDEDEDENDGVPIFVSENARDAEVVLILLCGSGAVMAGQWARKLCMNDSLHEGSVIPLLVWAQQRGIGTVVLNPNFKPEGGPRISAEAHVVQAWDQVISGLPAKHLAMVAHSYGGVCTCRLLSVREEEVLERLRCVAFTDSVHGTWGPDILSSAGKRFFVRNCVNWVQSEEPLDTLVAKPFLPAEDQEMEPEFEAEPERVHAASAYDEELGGEGKGKERGGQKMSGAEGGSFVDLTDSSNEKKVTAADVGGAAAGLGFFEEEAVEVGMDEGETPAAEMGGSGIILELSDAAAMADAIDKEDDPSMKAMLVKLAGRASEGSPGVEAAGPSGAHDDVSGAHDDVSGAAGPAARDDVSRAAPRPSKRGGAGGGRPVRKAQKKGFSWAMLGKDKEHCSCREVSAGVDEHERTTYSALESVKEFLETRLKGAGAKLRSD